MSEHEKRGGGGQRPHNVTSCRQTLICSVILPYVAFLSFSTLLHATLPLLRTSDSHFHNPLSRSQIQREWKASTDIESRTFIRKSLRKIRDKKGRAER